jgi:type II secretory pathway pseudopilin PulG
VRALSSKRAGFTLVETLIATTAAALLMGLVAVTVQRANGLFQEAGTASGADTAVQRAVERIARELMQADRGSLTFAPNPITGADTLTYRRASAGAAGGVVLGPLQQLRWERSVGELDDGLDNDGDGLVDEGRVVLSTDIAGLGPDVVLVEGVSERLEGEFADAVDNNGNGLIDERGLVMTFDAGTSTVTVRLTVARVAANGRIVERTATTTVRIRNE